VDLAARPPGSRLHLRLSEPVAEYIAALVDATRRPRVLTRLLDGIVRGWAGCGAGEALQMCRHWPLERGGATSPGAWVDVVAFVTPERVCKRWPSGICAPAPLTFLDLTALARGVQPGPPASRSCGGKKKFPGPPDFAAKPRRSCSHYAGGRPAGALRFTYRHDGAAAHTRFFLSFFLKSPE